MADGTPEGRCGTATGQTGRAAVAYDAFISYSHAKDKPIATALQSVVQKLGKPWYRGRALRVFRDDTSLSATPHLWPSIEQALGQSRFLILLASPEAAASQWVGQEIAYWLNHNSADTVLIALTAGELDWDQATSDFRWSEMTPLPTALKNRFADEPRWIDLRPYRDGSVPKGIEFMGLGADFAAAIRGVPKEDLLSEEVRQQRRARRLARAAVTALVTLLMLSIWQCSEAVKQTHVSRSRELAALATNQLTVDPVDSVRLARDAASDASTLQAGEALRRALFASHVRLVIPGGVPGLDGAPGVVAAFDHAGVAIATARSKRGVELWSVADGHRLTSFQTDLELAFVAFEDEDHALAVTASDGSRQVWQIDPERTGSTANPVRLSAPGRKGGAALTAAALVSFASDQSVVVTSLTTGQERTLPPIRLPSSDDTDILAISPDGKWMAVVTKELGDFDAFIVDTLTGEVKQRLEGHEDKVSKAAFSPDSQTLATIARWVHTESGGGPSALGDKVVRLWNVSSAERSKELRGHTREIRDVSFSPNGNLVVTASADETARLWDANTGRELTVLRGHQSPVQSATFSADGTHVLTTAEDGSVRLWEAVAGKEVRLQIGSDHTSDNAQFSSDARRVLMVDNFDNRAAAFDSYSGTRLFRVEGKPDGISNASFSPDGESLLTTGRQEIQQHRIRDGKVLRRASVTYESGGSLRAVMSPDGQTLAVTTGWENIAAGAGASLIRNFGGRNEILPLAPERGADTLPVYRANFNRDGRLLVAAGEDYEAAVYAVATGTLVRRLSAAGGHKDRLLQAAFSPDDMIITTSRDTSAILWDSEGKIAHILRGHDDAVTGAAFSSDGVLVATVGDDNTVRVWDVATGTALTLLGGLGGVIDAVFSPDGHALLTVSSDAVVHIYPLPAYRSIPDMTEMASRYLNLVAR